MLPKNICIFVKNTCLLLEYMLYCLCSISEHSGESLKMSAEGVTRIYPSISQAKGQGILYNANVLYSLESYRKNTEALFIFAYSLQNEIIYILKGKKKLWIQF